MGSLRAQDEQTAKRKGWAAAAATGGAVALMATVSLPLGVIALVPAAYLGWDWFAFRAKRGMRF
jgi:hypothetical protein